MSLDLALMVFPDVDDADEMVAALAGKHHGRLVRRTLSDDDAAALQEAVASRPPLA